MSRNLTHGLRADELLKHGRWIGILCVAVWSCGTVLAQGAAAGASTVVSKYITALQKRDHRTVIDLTDAYQAEIQSIRDRNPRVLWDQLIKEYYETKTKALTETQDFAGDFFSALGSMMGDPTRGTRGIVGLLPSGSHWKVTEERVQHIVNPMTGFDGPVAIVYVSVEYPSPAIAPMFGRRFLSQTILGFQVNPKTSRLLSSISRVDKADKFWTPPYPVSSLSVIGDRYGKEIAVGNDESLFPTQADQNVNAAIRDLLSLPAEVAAPVLRKFLREKSGPYVRAAEALTDIADVQSVPLIRDLAEALINGGPSQSDLCGRTARRLLECLGRFGDGGAPDPHRVPTFVRALQVILNDKEYGLDCAGTYVMALSNLDPAWSTFTYLSLEEEWRSCIPESPLPGTEFSRASDDLCLHRSRSSFINASSPTAPRLRAFLDALPPCNAPEEWACREGIQAEKVEVVDSNTVIVSGHVKTAGERYGYQDSGEYHILLRSSNNPGQPWTAVDGGSLSTPLASSASVQPGAEKTTASGGSSQPASVAWGTWQGTVTHPGSPDFQVVVTLELGDAAQAKPGKINYPDLRCGGSLGWIRMAGEETVYTERIETGKQNCMDGGTVSIRPVDSKSLAEAQKLSWKWSDEKSGIVVRSTLDRKKR